MSTFGPIRTIEPKEYHQTCALGVTAVDTQTVFVGHFSKPFFALQAEYCLSMKKIGKTTAYWAFEMTKTIVYQ